ncbi:MAG: ferritin-like domain-containing protein [Polyangiaceae bacterium]
MERHPPGMIQVPLSDGGTAWRQQPFLGRPLLADETPRVAEPTNRSDWTMALMPAIAALPLAERAALAETWARDAASEHASIASFSRFSLQLMALGAPADLVEAAHRAALDEARHARDAYALASAYAGKDLGPSPLDIRGTLDHVADVTLARLAVETFEHGCVGETMAAWDAREKLAQYNDPTVRGVLGRVAADEESHAELAWRAVAWAVRAGGDQARDALEESFARIAATDAIASHNLFASVIAPCAEALLG